MNISCSPDKAPSASSRALRSKRKEAIKRTIKDLLREVRRTQSAPEFCPLCGEPMASVDTTLWFYGEDESFNIRLRVCRCAEENPDQLAA